MESSIQSAKTRPGADCGSDQFSSVQLLSHVWPRETPWMQYDRLPCPSPTPRAYTNSVHRVSDAIQPSHPLSGPSPPAFILSQIQGLFQGVSSSYQVAKDWSFNFSISPSGEYSGLISFNIDWLDLLAAQRLSRVFSNTIVQNYHLFGAQLSLQPNSHIHTWLLRKP